MREETIKLYQFDELSDDAKEKARDWYRQASRDDSFWSEIAIDDAATVLKACGFDVYQRRVKLMGGGTRLKPAIYFSGFYSQGDGACFEGAWTPETIMPREQFCAEYPTTWTDANGVEHKSESNAELQRIHAESIAMRWIYRQLEREWEWINSDEQVDESIRTNGYEFTEDGERY